MTSAAMGIPSHDRGARASNPAQYLAVFSRWRLEAWNFQCAVTVQWPSASTDKVGFLTSSMAGRQDRPEREKKGPNTNSHKTLARKTASRVSKVSLYVSQNATTCGQASVGDFIAAVERVCNIRPTKTSTPRKMSPRPRRPVPISIHSQQHEQKNNLVFSRGQLIPVHTCA